MYEWIGKVTGNERAHRRLAKLLGVLPDGIKLLMLKGIGYVFFLMIGAKGRAAIERNMADLLGTDQRSSLRSLCLAYIVNIAVTLYEILIGLYTLPKLRMNERLGGKFTVQGERGLEEALARGKGAIVFTPHVGNFFYAYWYLSRKYDCLAVATAQSPEIRPIYLKFQDLGCRGIDYDATPPLEMIRTLRKHLSGGGVLFLLGDFYRPTFPAAEWFGRPTRSPEGAASLGIEQQAPVVPFYSCREKGLCHRLVFGTPLLLHERYGRRERSEATNELNRYLESVIRAVPSQWFYWFNADERWEQEHKTQTESGNQGREPEEAAG